MYYIYENSGSVCGREIPVFCSRCPFIESIWVGFRGSGRGRIRLRRLNIFVCSVSAPIVCLFWLLWRASVSVGF